MRLSKERQKLIDAKLILDYGLAPMTAEVARQMFQGLTAIQIAKHHKVSESAIRYHFKRAYRMTNSGGRDGLCKIIKRAAKIKR